MQILGECNADLCPSALGERNARAQSRVFFDPRNGELICSSGGKGLVSDVVSSVKGSIVHLCSLENSENSGGENFTKIFATSKEDICTAKMKPCVSCALDEQHRVFDHGGPASTTKAAWSGVLCMGVNRMRL